MLEIWIFTLFLAFAFVVIAFLAVRGHFQRQKKSSELTTTHIRMITERVRPVGRLVGLEVCAKEIVTATAGIGWLPPLLVSQAKIAMIFHFEKQYGVDLAGLGPDRVRERRDGSVEVCLPPVEGALRLLDVTPYDIQDGRVFGLVDVVPMNAARQTALMQRAQEQAGELFRQSDARYVEQARRSIERQLEAILALGGRRLVIVWDEGEAEADRASIRGADSAHGDVARVPA